MAWYYAEAGKQAGPVDDTQLNGLVQSGRIQPETLVWQEGMANWQPYNQVPAASFSTGVPPLVAAVAEQAVCAECGGVFNLEDTIAYGNARVCARFFTRFGAVFIDGLILGAVNIGIGFIGGLAFAAAGRAPAAGFVVLQVVLMFINLCIGATYETVLIAKYGATLGKMACKVKVVTAEGGQVSYARALGRYFAKMLSALTFMIGYLMAAFDDEKRALHDRICNTRVIVR
jgi:uncharacterized RDD family membrane protein YckC